MLKYLERNVSAKDLNAGQVIFGDFMGTFES